MRRASGPGPSMAAERGGAGRGAQVLARRRSAKREAGPARWKRGRRWRRPSARVYIGPTARILPPRRSCSSPPGLAGALGGADQRPAPRAPGQNQRPAPRAPERPRLGGPSYDARSTPRPVRGPGPGPLRQAAAAVTSDSPPRGLRSPLQLNCLTGSKLRARQQPAARRSARRDWPAARLCHHYAHWLK
jgi:hypothetical protein